MNIVNAIQAHCGYNERFQYVIFLKTGWIGEQNILLGNIILV